MKKAFSLLVMFVFLANTSFASAWVSYCLDMSMPAKATITASSDDMPCHSEQVVNEHAMHSKVDESHQHCDGACLCLHISVNQTPYLGDNQGSIFSATPAERVAYTRVFYPSTELAPPSPPPKSFA